ncbi:RICIN domain-containing protein [Actinoplanes sp. DH11]|uniref:RICIN domain-containing protein n=1 Tax=Actinoplanes sp. DH11 TaxID=2857011 RepID=UPI001E2D924A|nr:RICIN domain-containing protein [Actinoplanes sp. DH11]
MAVGLAAVAGLVAAALLGPAGAALAVPGPPPLIQGWIVTERNPSRCLTGGPVGTIVHTGACKAGNKAQSFYQTSEGHFTNDGNCMEPDGEQSGARIRVAACTFTDEQDWWFTGTLRAGENGRCVTEVRIQRSGVGVVRLRDCSDKANRKWRGHTPW